VDQFRAKVEGERPYLLRYASLQLRDRHAAEDAVQETLLAALDGAASFGARASVRTWLVGILKHKIVDAIRRSSREVALAPDDELADVDRAFDERGHWKEHPPAWNDPEGALEQQQFFEALEQCLARLPAKASKVFLMREHMGFDTEDICKELGITQSNCWVLLYRARMALRECLQARWFSR
jgi:RNA polymerase sigma-70 factor (ECF subfamily)